MPNRWPACCVVGGLVRVPVRRLPALAEACKAQRKRQWLHTCMREIDAAMASADDALPVHPDAKRRLSILEHLGYLDAEGQLTLKGRVACELNTATAELPAGHRRAAQAAGS